MYIYKYALALATNTKHVYITENIFCNTEMSGNISLRLPHEILEKLDDLAQKEHKDRSTLIREILDEGIKDKRIDLAVELYRKAEVTGWQAAKLAGVSLRRFYEALQRKGVLIQYGERDLDQDLNALRGE
jgi:predicted HTH domain antitoxin